ncbi:MAG: phosphoribosylaminoimidazole-succinocarboxamide synthase [Thermoproteota archaeon]|nr:phosphoribosylaminoimidazole-succinocarboxamide synthase [Thermoproteota archaeon]
MQLLKSGKVKDVYEVNAEQLEFVFSDRISIFDKIIPSMIPRKGETLARTSAYWFEALKEMRVPSHYIKLNASNRMLVKRVNVINDYTKINGKTRNYLIPLECVTRFFVYGSLWDRVKDNSVNPESLGFPKEHKISIAEPLPKPFFEVTTKLEKVDRHITTEEALRISGLSLQEYDEIKEMILKIDGEINSRVWKRGLIHVDGKKEFAFDEKRNLMVVDTFGTADEDRFWDAAEFEKGKCVEKSKEYVRQYYRETGYYDLLVEARKNDSEEPPIPPLPPEMIKQVSNVYISLYEEITGLPF